MAKILVIDDSSFMRKVLTDMLTKNGHDVVEGTDGNEAIQMYDQEQPDMMIIDVIMPNTDGIAVLKELVPRGAKAVVVSAVGQDEMMNQAKESGALGYVVKPFEEEQVMGEVNKVLA